MYETNAELEKCYFLITPNLVNTKISVISVPIYQVFFAPISNANQAQICKNGIKMLI